MSLVFSIDLQPVQRSFPLLSANRYRPKRVAAEWPKVRHAAEVLAGNSSTTLRCFYRCSAATVVAYVLGCSVHDACSSMPQLYYISFERSFAGRPIWIPQASSDQCQSLAVL